MQKVVFIIAVLFTISVSAQSNYDVIIVPKKYSFLNEENKYNLNSLTKSFFETEGFKVFYAEDNLPKEIANNRCNVLFADVVANNSLFVSKLEVVLTDCQNNIILTSSEGTSREKDYHKAYNEALRVALTSLRGGLKIKNLNAIEKVIEKPVVEVKEVVKVSDASVTEVKSAKDGVVYALPIPNGYKIVDSTPNVIYLIYVTSNESVFIASKGEIKGVFMKKMNGWYFDYYQKDVLVSEKVEVKF